MSTVARILLERFCRAMKDNTVFAFSKSENLFREVAQRSNGLSDLVANSELQALRERGHLTEAVDNLHLAPVGGHDLGSNGLMHTDLHGVNMISRHFFLR